MSKHRKPLRVIASPAFKSRKAQPYNWMLYTQLERLGVTVDEFKPALLRANPAAHIWHLHWPENALKDRNPFKAAYKMLRLFRRLRVARGNGIRIVWTVHNLSAHERHHPWLERIYWRGFLPRVDACIHLSEQGRALALQRFPELGSKPGFVVPLIHYRDVYVDNVTRSQARERLALPDAARVMLFFGQIRAYKNVPHLVTTFRQLPDPQARLVVAGWPRAKDLDRQIRAAAGDDDRVQLHLEFIPDERLPDFLRAADVAVTAYQEVLNSATALLALSFGCPLLAPNKGALRELQQVTGERWITLYDGELTPELLQNAVSAEKPAQQPDLNAYEADRVAEKTLAAYRSIASR